MSDAEPVATMRERVGGNRLQLWVLLTANRTLLTGLLTSGLFLTLVVAGALDTTSIRALIREGTHIERLFQSFIMSLITGITLVVTLNQLVLSRELGPLGEQHTRMSGAVDFQQYVEEFTESILPPDPASLMQVFMRLVREKGTALQNATKQNANDDVRDSVALLVERIRTHADEVENELTNAQFGQFEVIPAVLNYNYSRKIYETRQIRSAYKDSLSEAEQAAFDDLIQVLHLFGPAREHFKTLYFRRELVDFSRKMLYTGVPALAISILGLVYIDPNSFVGSTAGIDNLIFILSAAIAIATTPFFILVAYILRLGTIAKRTLAIGPFILRDAQHSTDSEGGERQ